MRDARFGAPPIGDVLVHGHPAAVRHRLVRNGDRSPVGKLLGVGAGAGGREVGHLPHRFLNGRALGAMGDAMTQDVLERGSRTPELFGQVVHRGVARVADDQPAAGVEHTQAVRHVVERDVEPQIDLLQLGLAFEQFDGVVLENLHEQYVVLFVYSFSYVLLYTDGQDSTGPRGSARLGPSTNSRTM